MLRFFTSVANVIEWTIIACAVLIILLAGCSSEPARVRVPVAAKGDCTPQGCTGDAVTGCHHNCVSYAWRALASVHIKLRTLPSITVNSGLFKHPGAYARGVANVRDIEDCHTLLHEFVHHAQWLKYGDARTLHENWQREMDAAHITMLAESEYGAPRCE